MSKIVEDESERVDRVIPDEFREIPSLPDWKPTLPERSEGLLRVAELRKQLYKAS